MRIVNRILPFLLFAACCMPVRAQQRETYSVAGRVIDRLTRQPVPYASVVVAGDERKGASSDSTGRFVIERVPPGICRFAASSVGYKSLLTSEYLVSAATPFVEIELEEDATRVEAVTVRPSPFRATVESPVGLNVIGIREIEKSPGSNRDISRIVRSYPGVAFSPVGYRNDLIVRGGGPSENKFFMDGIEIPNINHFATQGATGGPVSIVNADLIQEISFYTGAFPADRAGALSSVLDFRLRDGNAEKQTFKATLGASDAGVSGSGHIGGRTTYVFSLRQSYLQLLFKMLGLPFLPNYIDGQVKVKTRLTERDELTVLALAGIDNMKLNVDEKGEDAEYLLSYLPRIRQETFTVGASWRHYAGRHVQTVTLSHNYLNNRNLKYRNNDASSEENLTLRLRSVEQKTSLRAENRTYAGRWTLRGGVELNYSHYTNRTLQRLYAGGVRLSDYRTRLGIVGWGLFAGADYASGDRRFTASAGLRADGCDYSARMARPWLQLSPRASVSYVVAPGWTVSGSAGLYYQLPPYTALGFKEEGAFVNRDLRYMRVGEVSAGASWRLRDRLIVSVEGFWKGYGDVPLSLADGIPLSCKGNDYGVVGNDQISNDRFLYLSTVNTNANGGLFGSSQTGIVGYSEYKIGADVTWEKAYKADIGIELRFLKDRLSLQGDFFDEDRRDILLERKSIPNVTGISTAVYANMGHVRNRGVDAVLEWRDTSPGGFYYSFYGNFTYAHNHIVEDDTPHPRYDWLETRGRRIDQPFGYIALGFFTCEEEIADSPTQTFMTEVRPGDVKYLDLNGDGKIRPDDRYDM